MYKSTVTSDDTYQMKRTQRISENAKWIELMKLVEMPNELSS